LPTVRFSQPSLLLEHGALDTLEEHAEGGEVQVHPLDAIHDGRDFERLRQL
jgi:hypothetical protein